MGRSGVLSPTFGLRKSMGGIGGSPGGDSIMTGFDVDTVNGNGDGGDGGRFSFSTLDQLEMSFWQQHPQLLHMSGFLLEHCQSACHAHLKEKVVGAAVRDFWDVTTNLRSDLDRGLASYGTEAAAMPGKLQQQYSSRLQIDLERVHSATLREGRAFVEEFVPKRLGAALPELFSLYPGNERIQHLAVGLIQTQALRQGGVLVDFLSAYARRKLAEVASLSEKQYSKYLSEKVVGMARQGKKKRRSIEGVNQAEYLDYNNNSSVFECKHQTLYESWEALVISLKGALGRAGKYFRLDASMGLDQCSSEGHLLFLSYAPSPSSSSTIYSIQRKPELESTITNDNNGSDREASYCLLRVRNNIICVFSNIEKVIMSIAALAAHAMNSSKFGTDKRDKQGILCPAIANLSQLLESFTLWTADLSKILNEEKQGGRVKIEMAKLFTATLPALLYLDIVSELLTEPKPDKSIETETETIQRPINPSDAILKAIYTGGLSLPQFARIIASTCRPTVIGFYTLCEGYHQLKRYYGKAVISLVSRLVLGSQNKQGESLAHDFFSIENNDNDNEKKNSLVNADPNIALLSSIEIPPKHYEACCHIIHQESQHITANNDNDKDEDEDEEEELWFQDSNSRQVLKRALGPDFTLLIGKLSEEC